MYCFQYITDTLAHAHLLPCYHDSSKGITKVHQTADAYPAASITHTPDSLPAHIRCRLHTSHKPLLICHADGHTGRQPLTGTRPVPPLPLTQPTAPRLLRCDGHTGRQPLTGTHPVPPLPLTQPTAPRLLRCDGHTGRQVPKVQQSAACNASPLQAAPPATHSTHSPPAAL